MKRAKPLSEREKTCLAFLQNYLTKHGYSPSMREIAEGVGLAAVSSVPRYLNALTDAGLLTRNPKVSRSIVLTKKGRTPL